MSWSRGIELFTLIEQVVVAMRDTGSISSVAASGNYYRYEVANTLTKNDYISITHGAETTENLRVISADSSGFELTENIPTAATYTANAPYFMHEKIARAAEIFTGKESKGITVKWQKYPLVLLVHSYPQNQDSSDFAYSSTFDIYIITDSKQEYRSEDRYSNNITPKLIPIQEALIQGLADSIHTKINYPEEIDKEWEDLLFIENNPFPDKLDGIKLRISDLEILESQTCTFPTPDTFDVTTSVTPFGGGVINSNPEVLTGLAKNRLVSLNASANLNYNFVSLLIKDQLYYNTPQAFYATQDDTIIATFERSIEPEIEVYTSNLTTSLSEAQIARLNTLVIDLKVALNVTLLSEVGDVLYIRANETKEAALKNIISDQYHSELKGSPNPAFTKCEGFLSDGVNGYIDTGYNPKIHSNNFTTTNASILVYSRNDVNMAAGTDLGSRDVSGISDRTMFYIRSVNTTGLFIANSTDGNTYTQDSSKGLFIGTKDNLELKSYKNGLIKKTENGTNQDFYNGNLYELGLNSGGSAIGLTTHQLAITGCFRKFTDREVLDVTVAIEKYMDSIFAGVIDDYYIDYTSPLIDELQGYSTDGLNHYCMGRTLNNNTISVRDEDWNVIEENLTPFVGTNMNHMGDGQYYDSKVYVVGSKWIDASTSTDQNIIIYSSSDLSRISINDISAQGGNIAGCCIVPNDNTIYVVYFDEPNIINKYNLTTFTFEGTITITSGVDGAQGIAYKNEYFYISSHGTTEGIYKVAKDGSTTELIFSHNLGESEGIDYTQDELRFQIITAAPKATVQYIKEFN